MKSTKVTDPAILAQLNEDSTPVNDPDLLSQLNSEDEEDPGAYLDSLQNQPGFLAKLPRNIAAGLANLGHSTINQPYDIVKALEGHQENINKNPQKSEIPDELQEIVEGKTKRPEFKLSSIIPHQQEYDFANLLGQEGEGTLMDKIIQKGVEHSPDILGGAGLIRGGVRRLLGHHQLDVARDVASNMHPSQNGLTHGFAYTPDAIAEARRYLPNSRASNELLQEAQSGAYQPAFALQSQVGHHQRAFAKSPLASEQRRAPRAGELKQEMLDQLEAAFRSQGEHRGADQLRQGINQNRRYHKTKEAAMPYLKWAGIPMAGVAGADLIYKLIKRNM